MGGDSCCFVAATTYGLLGTGQAQIVDIRQEDTYPRRRRRALGNRTSVFGVPRGSV
jgi:hypothetical protein